MADKRTIEGFTIANGHGFLSNFHPSTIYIDGKPYPDVEHAIQAHKTTDEKVRDLIRRASTPEAAKKLGHAIILRPDWADVRLDLMRRFVRLKFESPFLRSMLLETGDDELVNVNTYNDTYWGVCRGKGFNWLGRMLVEERERIRAEETERSSSEPRGIFTVEEDE